MRNSELQLQATPATVEHGAATHAEALTMFNVITRATITPITHGAFQDLIAEMEAHATHP